MSTRHRTVLIAISVALAALATLVGIAPSQAAPATTTPTVTGDSCPRSVPASALRDGSGDIGAFDLCKQAVAAAATTHARRAIKAAFHMLGAPYACNGVGRTAPFRFDCSSLVSRAYSIGAGIDSAGSNWASSTQDMVPWGGSALADWLTYVSPSNLRPGDLVLYDTGGATYRHVVMYLGNGYMLHTGYCGDVANVTSFWGFNGGAKRTFLVARRVILPGQTQHVGPVATDSAGAGSGSTARPSTGTAHSGVAAFTGNFAPGAKGPMVASIQKALIRHGYTIPAVQSGAVAYGAYGSQTRDAVVLYQQENGAHGAPRAVVNRALYIAITGWKPSSAGGSKAGSSASTTSSRSVSLARVLSRQIAAVKIVQAGLNHAVGAGLPLNGKWGPMTAAAFDQFRREVMHLKGASATGTPGMVSLRALGRSAGFRVTA